MPAIVSEIVPFLFLLMLIGSASFMIGLGLYTRRFHDNPAALPYQILMFFAAYWSLDYALDLSTTTLSLKIFWQEIRFLVNPFFSVVELWLILAFLDKTRWIRGWRWKALLIIPIITALLAITSRYHTLFRYNYEIDLSGPLPTLTMINGPWYTIFVVYSYLLIMTGLLLLVVMQVGTHRIYLKQRILLFIALMAPSVLDILFQLRITPIHNVNPAPVFLWIIGIIYIIALFKFGFLDLVPIARSRVIEEMGMPMIVLSTDGKIADLNPAAGSLLGDTTHGGVGKRITSIAADWPEFIAFCSSSQTRGEIVKRDQEGERRFDASMDLLYAGSGTLEGRLILLTDTTIQKKLEQEIRTSEERWKKSWMELRFPS
ncbi:MAG: hypothetical protein LUQ50_10085 [Methanospirillum sp.]|uniref:histidine kinase N-terminal 7TM domain-containing protein n=1 Tax=Methanospirillum sp. TaxID=45200 RepID=UPI00236E32ED|nr:histidine kinase N-terminal 7TM domain-containing protein [Methanospirillum sp.]MDD1729406.1 hypothetical protein [Methanospirillum sp.]